MTGNDLTLGYGDNPMVQIFLRMTTQNSEVHGSNNNNVAVDPGPTNTRIVWLAPSGSTALSTENHRAEMAGNDLPIDYGDNPMAKSIL